MFNRNSNVVVLLLAAYHSNTLHMDHGRWLTTKDTGVASYPFVASSIINYSPAAFNRTWSSPLAHLAHLAYLAHSLLSHSAPALANSSHLTRNLNSRDTHTQIERERERVSFLYAYTYYEEHSRPQAEFIRKSDRRNVMNS